MRQPARSAEHLSVHIIGAHGQELIEQVRRLRIARSRALHPSKAGAGAQLRPPAVSLYLGRLRIDGTRTPSLPICTVLFPPARLLCACEARGAAKRAGCLQALETCAPSLCLCRSWDSSSPPEPCSRPVWHSCSGGASLLSSAVAPVSRSWRSARPQPSRPPGGYLEASAATAPGRASGTTHG